MLFGRPFGISLEKELINTLAYNSFAHTSGKDTEEDIEFRAPKLSDFVHSEEVLRGDVLHIGIVSWMGLCGQKMNKSLV